jgi:cysteine-rich repeat protein
VYAAAHFDHALAVFARDPGTGALTFIEREIDGIGGVDGLLNAQFVTVSPDAAHVYVSAFIDNAVSVFRNGCGNTTVDAGEQCDDGNTTSGDCCSATCQYEPASTVCRAAAGVCDLPEQCDGSGVCLPDGFVAAGTPCRPVAGACDVAESCDGSGPACPGDGGLPDGDGDGTCDVEDNCPALANVGQADDDADDLGNACDPCTLGASVTKHKLTLVKLVAPAGDEKLSLKGEALLAPSVTAALDPIMAGARLLIVDALGAPVVDTMVAGGAYDTGLRTGWKVNGSATAWTYKNPGTHPQGLTLVGVKLVPATPGLVKVKAKGKAGTYPVNLSALPLRATLVLAPPTAQAGECVEAIWPAVPPAGPSCVATPTGTTVRCK